MKIPFFNRKKTLAEKQSSMREPELGERAFDSARISPYAPNWIASAFKTNADLIRDGRALILRSREMAKNSGDYRKYLRMCERNVVGSTGFKLQMNVRKPNGEKDEAANREIEARWERFGQAGGCTVTRLGTMRDFAKTVVRNWRIDGEVFLRRVRGYRNRDRFAWQLLDPMACPFWLNENLPDGRKIRLGVELDEWEAPTAYYFMSARPESMNIFLEYDPVVSVQGKPYIRIPAEEVNHFYTVEFRGQVRGFPLGTAAMQTLSMLDIYYQVELIAADASSRKLGKMINEELSGAYGGRNQDGKPAQPQYIHQDPGSWDVLHGKWKMETYDPQHPVGNFSPFVKAQKRAIANGLDVAYNTFANDLEGVNFSSIRSGVLDEREAWMDDQEKFIGELLVPEFGEWLKMQFYDPSFPYSFSEFERLNKPVFLGRRWPWVDPMKDAQAALLQMSMGATTPQDIAANLGNDFDENAEAVAEAGPKLAAMAQAVGAVNAVNGAVANGDLTEVPEQQEE